jgi:hypothetical protein
MPRTANAPAGIKNLRKVHLTERVAVATKRDAEISAYDAEIQVDVALEEGMS